MHLSALRTALALTAALLVLALGASTASALPTLTDQTRVWQQTFGDEFSGVTLDPAKWGSCYWWVSSDGGCTNANNGELQWYTPANVLVSDGTVKLRAQKQTVIGGDGKTYDYTSGLISTGRTSGLLSTPPKFEFKYGYMEMRAKAPLGAGLWSGFWTLPSNQDWPPEIDVMETRGDRPNDYSVGVYNKLADGSTVHGQTWVSPGSDLTAGFHTYAVDWQPSRLDYYIDGVLKIRVTDTARIPSVPMYVLANLAIGGSTSWSGAPTDATPFPSDLEIDYIRVFEQKPDTTAPTVTITSPTTSVRRSTSVAVTATATDNVSVTKVDMYAGSTLICSDTTAPYSCTWQTPGRKLIQPLTVKAYDPAGNVGTRNTSVSVL